MSGQSKKNSSSMRRLAWLLPAIVGVMSLAGSFFVNELSQLVDIAPFWVWLFIGLSFAATIFLAVFTSRHPAETSFIDNLDPNFTTAPPHISPAALLVARYQIVPFNWQIRQKEEQYLKRWCFSSKPVDIALFTGPGGTGKTRLFIEWSKVLRVKHKWNAGFLRQNQIHTNSFGTLKKSALIVIDYAECRSNLAAFLAQVVACKPSNKAKLRIVLLAREQSDWWLALKENESCRELSTFLSTVNPHVLSFVAVAGADRKKIYQDAYSAFSTTIKKNKPIVVIDISAGEYGRLLYLHVAALNALLGNNTVFSPLLLLKEMVLHERNFWMEQFGTGLDDLHKDMFRNFACRLVASLTLRGGCATQPQAVVLFGQLSGSPPVDVSGFTEFLHRLYPGQKGAYLGTLEPDLIGEELVRSVLTNSSMQPDFLDVVLATADAVSLMNAFIVLGRIGSHDPGIAKKWIASALKKESFPRIEAAIHAAVTLGRKGITSPLAKVLADVMADIVDVAICKKIYSLLPKQSFSLAIVAVPALMKQIQSLTGSATDANFLSEKATLLNNLGNHFRNLGRREDALISTQEAVDIRRQLSEKNPDAFLPVLSTSLNNISIMHSNLGHREEAVSPIMEAIAINRHLAEKNPDAYLPELASNLSNLGNLLRILGRPEPALVPAQEAVDTHRRLSAKNPDAFLPDFAASLNNLVLILRELNRNEDAIRLAQETNTIHRQLADKNSDVFLPTLAMGLNNISIIYSDLDIHENAFESVQEAVGIHRQLAEQNPNVFLSELAMSLTNLGLILRDLHRPSEAIGPTQEAVDIRRRLSEKNPDVFLPELAQSLTNLGLVYNDSGHSKEALGPAQEAVNILRPQLKKNPGAFLPEFTGFLINLGVILRTLGRHKEASAAFREAENIRRRLSK